MAFTYTDVISELKTLISNNWTKSNTDNIKPNFEYIYSKKRLDSFWNGDWILLQRISVSESNTCIGNIGRDRKYRLYVDIRSDYIDSTATDDGVAGITHITKMEKEFLRLIDTNATYQFTTGTGTIELDEGLTDMSDGLKNAFRSRGVLKITKYNEAVS